MSSQALSPVLSPLQVTTLITPDYPFSKEYSESLSRYQEVLETALHEVQEYCREKEWLCEIRAFVRTWKSVDRYKGSQATYIQE